jgi:hypothetical protein
VQRLDRHPRVADDPQLGLRADLGERLEQVLQTLIRAQQAEGEDDRALGAIQLRRQRLLLRQAEAPCGITRTRSAGSPTSSRSRLAPCSEWATTASIAPKTL